MHTMDTNTMPKDYTQPTRMSWEALVINSSSNIVKLIKSFFVLFILFIVRPENTRWIIIGFLVLILLSIVTEIYSHFHSTFQIKGDKLIFRRNMLLNTTERTIPLNRVHAYRTKSNIIYQLVDVVGITFDTLANDEDEIELILSQTDLSELMVQVDAHIDPDKSTIGPDKSETDLESSENIQTLKYSVLELTQGALVQNHLKGLAAIGYGLWFIYSELNDVINKYLSTILDYSSQQIEQLTWQSAIIIFIIAYIISALLMVVMIQIRYYGMTMTLGTKKLTYSAGLFNHVTNKFDQDKVFGISLRQNILERYFSRLSIRLEQAANVQGKNQKNEIAILGIKEYQPFVDWWLGSEVRNEEIHSYAHSSATLKYLTFMRQWLWICLVFIGLSFVFPIFSLTLLVLTLIISVIDSVRSAHRSDIAAREDMIVIHQGGLSERTTYLSYEGIETIKLVRSPFAVRSNRRKLIIYTRGTQYTIRSLEYAEALEIYDYILYRVETLK